MKTEQKESQRNNVNKEVENVCCKGKERQTIRMKKYLKNRSKLTDRKKITESEGERKRERERKKIQAE